MSQRFVDDKTGLIITADRSYQVGIYCGDETQEARDFESIEDLLNCIRNALSKPGGRLPLAITVRTWTHLPHNQASWE